MNYKLLLPAMDHEVTDYEIQDTSCGFELGATGCRVTGAYGVTGLRGYGVTGLRGYGVTGLRGYGVT
ncbi:hypothetical protein, partial [Paenibacillus sp. TC-CSREp1]|uniref:hypothetical protein n=1 Tax=Paenibacillus sp. TC-CSREp1 TaxID=3410089 RepID=UPI003CFD9BF7